LNNRLLLLNNAHLSFHWVVFNSLLVSIDRHVLDVFILIDLRNILGNVFNSLVFSNITFARNLNTLSNFFILHHRSLIRNVFNATLSLDWLLV
jgi:hypothetical protein